MVSNPLSSFPVVNASVGSDDGGRLQWLWVRRFVVDHRLKLRYTYPEVLADGSQTVGAIVTSQAVRGHPKRINGVECMWQGIRMQMLE